MQQNVYELLQKEKHELETTENALLALESEKNSFLRNMEERDTVFSENISVFDINESNKELQSVVDFVRNKVSFKGEMRRRSDHFLVLYEAREEELLAAKQEHEQQMAQLTAFSQDVESPPRNRGSFNNQALYIEEAKIKRINRFLFLLDNAFLLARIY